MTIIFEIEDMGILSCKQYDNIVMTAGIIVAIRKDIICPLTMVMEYCDTQHATVGNISVESLFLCLHLFSFLSSPKPNSKLNYYPKVWQRMINGLI